MNPGGTRATTLLAGQGFLISDPERPKFNGAEIENREQGLRQGQEPRPCKELGDDKGTRQRSALHEVNCNGSRMG